MSAGPRALARASTGLSAARGLTLLLQAAHFALVARLTDPATFAGYIAATALVTIAAAVAEFGLVNTVVLRRQSQPPERAGDVLAQAVGASARLAAVSLALALPVAWLVLPAAGRTAFALLVPWFLVSCWRLPFVAERRFRLDFARLAAADLADRGIPLAALVPVALVGGAWSGTVQLAVVGLGLLLGALVAQVVLAPRRPLRTWLPRRRPVMPPGELIRQALPLGATGALSLVHARVDQVVLAGLGFGAGLAAYGVAYRLFDAALALAVAAGAVTFPALARARGAERDRVVRVQSALLGALAVVAGLAVLLLAPQLVRLLGGDRYPEAVGLVRLLSPALVLAVLNLGVAQVAIVEGKARELLRVSALCAGVNLVLNLALDPRFGPTGAAFATVATEALGLVLVARVATRARARARAGTAAAGSSPVPVAHVITRLAVGGAQETALRCCSLLDRECYRPLLVTGPEAGREGDLHGEAARRAVPVVVVPSLRRALRPWADAVALVSLVRLFRRERPGIVHTHSSKAGVLGRLAARLAGVPVVVHTVHGWSFHEGMSRAVRAPVVALERLAARWTSALVVVAERDREEGLRAGIGEPGQYALVRSGIDLSAHRVGPGAAARARAQLGLPAGVPLVGTVTRFYPQKDPSTLVAAMARVLDTVPAARLVVVGDGPLRPEVEALVARLGIASQVTLLGWCDRVAQVLPAFDVFVSTGRWEGLPRAVVEAAAAGVPVVATDVGGTREVVVDGETGLLVPPADPDRLARALTRLLTTPELRLRLRRAAAAAVAEFDAEVMIERLESLYEALLEGLDEGLDEGFGELRGRSRPRRRRMADATRTLSGQEVAYRHTPATPSATRA